MKHLSIIIPALNEETKIATTVLSVLDLPTVEVIVADGGSSDLTVEKAQQAGARIIITTPGRGRQMNAGARIATGDVLLFLHADTRLPECYKKNIEQVLADSRNVAGGFRLTIDGKEPGLRFVEWAANCRSKYRQMIYGDQTLFISRQIFNEIGGFANIPLMEDVELIQRLKKKGRIGLADAMVITSARRWLRHGILRTTLINQFILAAYCLGVKPELLARWYTTNE